MGQINEEKLSEQWQSKEEKYLSNLTSLPSDCIFSKSKKLKITLSSFVYGFILMLLKNGNSLNHWAMHISSKGGFLLSKQGLSKKLQMSLVHFFEQLLLSVLSKRLQETTPYSESKSGLLSSFTNVYIEDSTCISLPDNLSEYFKSSYSRAKERATARLQVCINLKSHYLAKISLQSYRDNDQKHASEIVSLLKKGDLLIRDLGYAVIKSFKAVISLDAFFLSRLRSDILIYLPSEPSKPLNLYDYLSSCEKKGLNQVDIWVQMGAKEKLPVRFVAIKLPQAVADERRRKANLNRDKRQKNTDSSMFLLGWAIFVTNVSLSIWQPCDLPKVYRMRWRIEIIFKTWKSHFHFNHIFQTTGMTYPRAVISFYLLLLFITLFFVQWFDYFFDKMLHNKQNDQRWLSIFKFADYVKLFFDDVINAFLNDDLQSLIHKVQYYCAYDKRKRLNDSQVLYEYFYG